MRLLDSFFRDSRTEVKTLQLFEVLKDSAKSELMWNAIKCEVPYRYIREMITGNQEFPDAAQGSKEDSDSVD